MHKCFDIGAAWSKRCSNVTTETVPGGHFFVDQFPEETARILSEFLSGEARGDSAPS
jgi:haloacetate dehalogenase